MIIKTVKGDLLDLFKKGNFDAIAHGCNCFHTMGAGIALQIASQFPEALLADKTTKLGSLKKLGNFSSFATEFGLLFNFYTQYYPGPHFEYSALQECLRKIDYQINSDSLSSDFVLGVPLIGGGIGGGKEQEIIKILRAAKVKIILVYYDR